MRLDGAGVRTKGQALVHLLMLACLRGIAVRGPMVGKEHAYVLVRDWLDAPGPVDRDRALAELARRYLAGHGPASDRDLAKWAGLPLRDARAGLAAIGSEVDERPGGLVDLAKRAAAEAGVPDPCLLGQYDPILLGWASREPILGPHTQLVTINGIFRPFAMVAGRAVATWRWAKGAVSIEPLERVPTAASASLEAEAEDVARFLTAA